MTEQLYTLTIETPYGPAQPVIVRIVDEIPAQGIYPARAVVAADDGFPFPYFGRGESIIGSGDIYWYNQREVNADRLTPAPAYTDYIAETGAGVCQTCETPHDAADMIGETCVSCMTPAPADNADRIAALFLEIETCDNFNRVLEIEQELRGYGVEAVTSEENRQLEMAAERGPRRKYPL